MKRKQEGSVMDFLSVCICILAMSIVLMVYLSCTDLLSRKGQISQVARCYMLKMETVGCLTEGDRNAMLAELQTIGLQGIDLTGSTVTPVEYGDTIILQIRGKLQGKVWRENHDLFQSVFTVQEIPVEEICMSTAKH